MENRRRHRPPGSERPAFQQDDPLFFSELRRLTGRVIPAARVSGIVIYGSGRHFSSGADLDDLLGGIGEDTAGAAPGGPAGSGVLGDNLKSFMFFNALSVPVVAAIRGVCLGSALELALFCHARVCGTGSVLGLPETSFGLIPGCGGIDRMAALAGTGRALELVLSGATFSADDALGWRIVDSVVPRADVVEEALRLIGNINGATRP